MSKIKKNNSNEQILLEEHKFIANCLQIGLKIEDLKNMEYKDVAKILVSVLLEEKNNSNRATSSDIDKFLG